jgi:hypothetical protein
MGFTMKRPGEARKEVWETIKISKKWASVTAFAGY